MFRFIDNLDRQFGNGSVWTLTRTGSDGPELVLTPAMVNWLVQEILISPSLSSWFLPSLLVSLVLYHHLSTQSYVIPIYLSMQWSWVSTEYSIHWVQHTPSTAYTEYSIDRVQHTPSTAYTEYSIHRVLHHHKIHYLQLPGTLSSLSAPECTQLSAFPRLRVKLWIKS